MANPMEPSAGGGWTYPRMETLNAGTGRRAGSAPLTTGGHR